MIALSDVWMGFGTQVLFEHASWQLQPGAHYGLVGANGAGKSTLLRLLAGELKPEGGTVSRPNDLALGTLGQDQFAYDDLTPLQVTIGGRPRLQRALAEKAALLARLDGAAQDAAVHDAAAHDAAAHDAAAQDAATQDAAAHEPAAAGGADAPHAGSDADGHRLAELEAHIGDAGGYQAEAHAGALLAGLGLAVARHARPMSELSGGFRLRVLLARTLFAAPELLLLDEPTNHLDIDSIRWLEGYLRAFPGTFVVVSHDRHFLNAVCSQIADVDYQELRLYPGDYDAFEAAKALAVAQKEAEIVRAEEKIAEMQRFIERFRAKATKARQAQSRKKQVERIELPEIRRSSRRRPAFAFTQRRPSGREVLTVQGVRKAYGAHSVLDGVSFSLERGERLAVVGPNGIGKSTLLRILVGQLAPDAGAVRSGYEVHVGTFAQDHHDVLKGRASAYEWLHAQAPGETVGAIRGLLGRVLFSGDEADKAIGDLSGGEAARLLLAALMLRQDNLLVLDEPTNHLDLEGREALMAALQNYEGTLVFVSHDRHFVSAVGRRILVLSSAGVDDVHGNYEDYLAAQGQDFLAGGSPPGVRPGAGAVRGTGSAAGAEDYADRKERKRTLGRLKKQVERLEADVARVESELAAIAARFAREDYYRATAWEQVQSDQQAQAATQRRLQQTLAEWERAAAELERVQAAS
jgi:ATPase subunit of ABC transporter with duplicated ATPase domains